MAESSRLPLPPANLPLWRQVPYLHELSDDTLSALMAAASPRTCETGEALFWEGETAAGLFLVESGVIKICRYTKDGREHILHLSRSGDTFNDVAAFDGGPNPATAIAHTPAVIWRVSREQLQSIARTHPDLAWALVESIARRTRYLVGIVQDLAMRNVKGRLARLLLDQALAAEQGITPPPLTQEEMANHLGTVREVVGRALRSLAAEGVIEVDRHRIVILDRAKLRDAAEV